MKFTKAMLIALSVSALPVAPASAARTDVVGYECGQMDPKRDGIRCAVINLGDGMGQTLFIRVHTTADAPEDLRKRTSYMIGRTIHNFLAVGGIYIQQRARLKDGSLRERACARVKRKNFEHCNDWTKPEPALASHWARLD